MPVNIITSVHRLHIYIHTYIDKHTHPRIWHCGRQKLRQNATNCHPLNPAATNTQRFHIVRGSTLQHTTQKLQHTSKDLALLAATHCNTLQHTSTHTQGFGIVGGNKLLLEVSNLVLGCCYLLYVCICVS